jgi:flagellar hook-basal body complex protein FliE
MDPLNLNPLNPVSPLGQTGSASPAQGTGEGPQFSDILKQALQEVNDASVNSEQEARNLISGNTTDMHTAILAVQKADVSFQMMMAVRSKLVSAYQEVMRMQM